MGPESPPRVAPAAAGELDNDIAALAAQQVVRAVAVFVADTGVGIPSDKLKLILEPLYSTKARGMGLGLTITRAIVIKNNCELAIDSEVGKGSRFTIRIPVASQL